MALIPNAFAQFLLSKQNKNFSRLKTQTLQLAQQYIVDGVGFTSNWLESAMASGASTASAQLVLNYAFIPEALVSPSEV